MLINRLLSTITSEHLDVAIGELAWGVHIFQLGSIYFWNIRAGGSKYFEIYGPVGTKKGGSKFVVTGYAIPYYISTYPWSRSQPLRQRSNCCRSRKCIRWHVPMHAIFVVFIYFFIPVLSRSCFTSRTPDKDQKIEQLFYFLLVQVP